MRLTPGIALLGTALAASAGCAGDDGTHGEEESVNCALVTDDDVLVAGLTKTGSSQLLDFTLMSADPATPSRGNNTWQLQIRAGGVPQSDAAISVYPFMPKHGHASPAPVVVTPAGEPGEYMLSPVHFFMPGVWEVTIDATSGAGTDTALFRFCIPS